MWIELCPCGLFPQKTNSAPSRAEDQRYDRHIEHFQIIESERG